MRIGSLFAGIGGLELGLERAGVGHTVWQVEQDEYCRRILAKHWPDAIRHDDVRAVGAHNLEPADVICGGFPCQDLSYAGKGAGLSGARSGLWSEFARIIRELRPRFIVVENVPALLSRGLGVVLGDLASCGYDATWDCIPAAAVGAPHLRYRLFVVAYASGNGCLSGGSQRQEPEARKEQPPSMRRYVELPGSPAPDPLCEQLWQPAGSWWACALARVNGAAEPVADAERDRCQLGRVVHASKGGQTGNEGRRLQRSGAQSARLPDRATRGSTLLDGASGTHWSAEPDVGRVADGIPARVDRLRALGNAVVPQVAEVVGRVLLQINEELSE